jgi:hypothetical protein
VVFDISPSVGAAIGANCEEIEVSRKSVYNKLNGVAPQVSAAFVHETAAHFMPVISQLEATRPDALEGYRVKILDGNHFKATEHRLKELRPMPCPSAGQGIGRF